MKLLFVNFCLFSIFSLNAQSINSNQLDSLLIQAKKTNSEAVIIYQNGKLISENYFGPGHRNKKIEAMSVTKSIVGLAVAKMLTDGLIDSLDIPVWHYFPEWKQGKKKDITIRHLVHMTSGLQNNPNAGAEIYPSPNFVQLALAAELVNNPGEVWSYNNKSLNLMAGIIEKISGKRMDYYIGERLFSPLGIEDYSWTLDDAGNPHVMAGCQIKARDLAKLGVLVQENGRYKETIVIKKEHLDEVFQPTAQYPGYGMLWWIDHEEHIFIVDDESINDLQNAGIEEDFIEKVRMMKGVYSSTDHYVSKLTEIFGENYHEEFNRLLPAPLRISKRQFKGDKIYRADGYLGNYIIVDPKTGIVAVRMTSYDSYKEQKDDFREFKTMVEKLTNN